MKDELIKHILKAKVVTRLVEYSARPTTIREYFIYQIYNVNKKELFENTTNNADEVIARIIDKMSFDNISLIDFEKIDNMVNDIVDFIITKCELKERKAKWTLKTCKVILSIPAIIIATPLITIVVGAKVISSTVNTAINFCKKVKSLFSWKKKTEATA